MAKPIISIIGLGLTGASLGLGLQQQEGNFEIVGHDKNPDAASEARHTGAVNRTEWNLHKACDGAELLVLAVPFNELEELLTLIGDDLTADSLVLIMCKVMQPVLALAEKVLPTGVHVVVGHPILTGIGGSLTTRSDLFDDAPFCIASSVNTDPDAVQLASDFVERMNAKPLFVDALEHDGIMAGMEQLPQFMGVALMDMVGTSAGWSESRRLGGRQFAQSTELSGSADRMFTDFQSNRENLLLRVDQMQQALSEWRTLLAADIAPESYEGEDHPLLAALKKVEKSREEWEIQALLQRWDEPPQLETGSSSGLMQQLFFGNIFRSRVAQKSDEGDRK